jgi:hypothetical protein
LKDNDIQNYFNFKNASCEENNFLFYKIDLAIKNLIF